MSDDRSSYSSDSGSGSRNGSEARPPASAFFPPSPDSTAFDALIDDYCSVWCRLHPVASVEVGVYDYADRLRPYADDDHAVLVSLNERLIKGLEEVDPKQLDPDRALDYDLAFGGAYLELDALKRHDWRHRDPQRFVPIDAIYQLLVRPVPDRIEKLSARLNALPEYLEASTNVLRSHAEQVSPDWLDNALHSLEAGRRFMAVASEHPQVLQSLGDDPVLADQDSKRLMFLLAGANEALATFQTFLQDQIAPHASGDYACGEERFNALLKYRHFLSADVAAIRSFGEKIVNQMQSDLKRVTNNLSGSDDVLALAERLRTDVIAHSGLLPAYRQTIESARRFVLDKDLVSRPAEVALAIEQTPEHLRYFVPFSDYIAAPAQNIEAQATYLVTPVDEADPIAGHDHRRIRHFVVSDTWPGKHLQACVTQQQPASYSLMRLLNSSSTSTRGWAMYSEHLMVEQGFLNGPEEEFWLLYNRLWRALGLLADVDLHTGTRQPEEIEQELQSLLGFTPTQAKAEVARYTRAPTQTMGYVCGWAQIRAARDLREASTTAEFSLKSFHDDFLRVGPISASLAIGRAFGSAAREHVDQELFGSA